MSRRGRGAVKAQSVSRRIRGPVCHKQTEQATQAWGLIANRAVGAVEVNGLADLGRGHDFVAALQTASRAESGIES